MNHQETTKYYCPSTKETSLWRYVAQLPVTLVTLSLCWTWITSMLCSVLMGRSLVRIAYGLQHFPLGRIVCIGVSAVFVLVALRTVYRGKNIFSGAGLASLAVFVLKVGNHCGLVYINKFWVVSPEVLKFFVGMHLDYVYLALAFFVLEGLAVAFHRLPTLICKLSFLRRWL